MKQLLTDPDLGDLEDLDATQLETQLEDELIDPDEPLAPAAGASAPQAAASGSTATPQDQGASGAQNQNQNQNQNQIQGQSSGGFVAGGSGTGGAQSNANDQSGLDRIRPSDMPDEGLVSPSLSMFRFSSQTPRIPITRKRELVLVSSQSISPMWAIAVDQGSRPFISLIATYHPASSLSPLLFLSRSTGVRIAKLIQCTLLSSFPDHNHAYLLV